jgi:hypothetical protein
MSFKFIIAISYGVSKVLIIRFILLITVNINLYIELKLISLFNLKKLST